MRAFAFLAALLLSACSCSYETHTLDAELGDGGTCPSRVTPALPPACTPLRELASSANAVTLRPGGGTAFALTGLAPGSDPARATCDAGYWEDGGDVRWRFTAPSGGRWRFTLSGDGIALLGLADCDAATPCTGDLGIRGEALSSRTVRDLEMQRGDAFAIVLDGCPAGVDCHYDLSVERIADLSCPTTFAQSPCASTEYCAIEACDPERFVCRTTPTPRLTRIEVFADETSGYIVAMADDGGAARGAYLLTRWLDASGAEVTTGGYRGGEVPTDGSEIVLLGVPPTAARGHFWLYAPDDPEGHEGLDANVVRWSGHRVGEACGSAPFTERCGDGLRCDAGTCASVSRVEITRGEAYYDTASGSLRVALEGLSPTTFVSEARLDLFDAAGAVLGDRRSVSVGSWYTDSSRVAFRVVFELAAPADVTRLRVIARDVASNESAPFDLDVVATVVGALGDACADIDRGCGAGLVCPSADYLHAIPRCEPPIPLAACEAPTDTLVWSPLASGTRTFRGVLGTEIGGFTDCLVGRVFASAQIELVAPTTGTYSLDLTGGRAVDLTHACATSAPAHACMEPAAPGAVAHVEADLTAGEHALITVLGEPGAEPFDLDLVVP